MNHNLDFQFKTHENGDDIDLCDMGGVPNADTSFGIDGNVVGLPELQESRDHEPTKRNGRYNLRKSLAWDSAFFTSAGVLDPEELSTMITGTDEAEKQLLPCIEEDINGSTESISTFHSDNLTLESHEDDLFVDIRASIQRSSKKPSIFTNANCKKLDIEVDNQAISALEKEELACPPCKNPKLSIKKTSGLQAVRTLKGQPQQNTGKPGSRGSLKQDSAQSQNTQAKSIAKAGPSTSILRKPPTATAKVIPKSTSTVKRDTMGAVDKSGCGSLKTEMASRKGTQPPKVPIATRAGRVLPKPVVSSKSSLASLTSSMAQSSKLSTSSDSSSSISSSSKAAAKFPIVTAKRNIIKTSNVVTGSATKSLSRATVKVKPASSSKNSAYTKTTKTSMSVSPSSSISEWSSVSSSSSSRVNGRSNNPRTSIDASSRKSTDSDITFPNRKNQSANQVVDVRKNKEIILPCNNMKKASTGSLQAQVRPSGLRLPSPKIGFFAGANSRTPNKPPQSQSGSCNVLSKSEAAASTPNRSSNIKPKSNNVPTVAKLTAVGIANYASSKGTSFASSKENDVFVLMDKDDAPIMSIETKDKATGQKYDKAEEVEVGAPSRVIDVVTSAIEKNLGELKNEILNEKSHASENNALVLMDKDNAHIMSVETKDEATEQKCDKAEEVEVGAAIRVIDVVTSVIEKNLGELKNEILNEKSHASENDALVLMDKDNAHIMSVETKDEATEQKCDKAEEVEVGAASRVIDVVTSAIEKNLGELKNEILNEKSHASENDALVLMDKDNAHIMSVETKDEATEQKCDKAEEVEVGAASRVIDVVTSAIEKNLGELKNEILNEKSHASEKDALVLMDKDNAHIMSVETKDEATEQKCDKAEEVEVGAASRVIDVVTSAIEKNLGELKNEILNEKSHASENDALVLMDKDNAHIMSVETKDEATEQKCAKEEVEVGAASRVIDVVTSAIEKNLGELKNEILNEKSHASEKDALVLMDKDDAHIMSVETKDVVTEQKCDKAEEVEVGAASRVIDFVMSAIDKNLGELKNEILNEKSHASENDALVLMDKYNAHIMSVEPKDEATDQKCDKADEVDIEAANQVIDVVTGAIEKSSSNLNKKILNEKSHALENDVLDLMDIDDAAHNARGQNYHKAGEVELAAGNQVIDAVMSVINKNLDELKKGMEQSNKEFGVVNIDQGGSGDVMVSHSNLDNNFYQTGSDKENGDVMIHQREKVKVQDRNVNIGASVPMNEVLSEILDCAVTFPAKAFTSSPIRSPFAKKNLFSDDECTSISKMTETKAKDTRASALPSMEKNENC